MSVGVDVYNLFNSDAALRYDNRYAAFLLPDGTWADDNPATPAVEVNPWGTILDIASPRHLKLTVQFDF